MKMQSYSVSVLIILCQCVLQTAGFINNMYGDLDPNIGIRHRGKTNRVKFGSGSISAVSDMLREIRDIPYSPDINGSPYFTDSVRSLRQKKDSTDTHKSPNTNAYNIKRGYDSIYEVAEPKDVGFHASLTHTSTVTRRFPTIKFDTVHEGIPDKTVYDVTSGTFESPVSGVYLVSFTLATQEERDVIASVYVRRNGKRRAEKRLSVVANGQTGTSQGSITGFVTMNYGDKLYAKVDYPSMAGVFGNELTSLSVYLVTKH